MPDYNIPAYTPPAYTPPAYGNSQQSITGSPIQSTIKGLAQKGFNLAGKLIDQFNRIGYGITNVAEDYTRTGQLTPAQSFKQGITLNEKPTWSDVLTNSGYNPTTKSGKVAKFVAGAGLDIALDPVTYLGIGGLTKLGKIKRTVTGLEDLVKAGKIAKQGTKYVAKAEDVGVPLMKTIDRTNRELSALHPDSVAKLIEDSAKSLDKIQEVQAGYRGILRTNPLITGGFSGGRQLVGGEGIYKAMGALGKYTDEFKTLRAAKELFVPPEKKIKEVKLSNELANIKSKKWGFGFLEESNKLAKIAKDAKFTDDELSKIVKASEWVEFDKSGKFNIFNTKKLKQAIGSETIPDRLRPAIEQFRKINDMPSQALRKVGLNIGNKRDTLKKIIAGLESPEGITNFMSREMRSALAKNKLSTKQLLSKIKLGKTGRLLRDEDFYPRGEFKVGEHGITDLATAHAQRNTFSDFFNKFNNKNEFVDWYMKRKQEMFKSTAPPKYLRREAVTEFNRINKEIVNKISKINKFSSIVEQTKIKYGTHLAEQERLLAKSPNYVMHALSEDAKDVVGRQGQNISRMKFDEKTVNFLNRKFIDEDKIPLGLVDVNDQAKIFGTRKLTAGRPVFKKETFISKSLHQRNRKLAEEFDALPTEAAKEIWVRNHPDVVGDIFTTDPSIILETTYKNTTKSLENAIFQNKIAKFGKTETELRQIGNGGIPSGWVQVQIPRLKSTSELPAEVVNHINFISRKTEKLFFPEKIAGAINSMYGSMGKEWSQVYSLIHNITNHLKAYLTVVRPSFFTRNLVSSIWMGYSDGVKTIEPYKMAMKLQWFARNGDLNSVKHFKIAGYTGEDILKLAHSHSVIDTHFYDVGESYRTIPSINKHAKWLNLGTEGKLIQAGRKTNQLIENEVRLATFIDGLEKGMTPLDSARRTLKIHYNYGDVTDFESKVMAQLIPFYRWMRFNTPRMIELLMQDPRKILGTTKAIANAQSILSDNQFVDEMLLPKYILDNFGVQVTRNDKGTVGYTILGSFFPFANLAGMDSPRGLWDTVISSLNPLIKTTVELALNKDAFFKAEIEKYEGESKKYLGLVLPRRAIKILQNVSILNDLDKLLQPKQGESLFRRLVAFNVGLKAYNIKIADQYKYAMINKKKEQAIIKSQIKNAAQKGDEKMKAQLMGKFRENMAQIRDLTWALNRSMQ